MPPILMAYIITNSSGNRCGVTEKRYYELVDKKGYTGEIIEDEPKGFPKEKGAGWFELSNGESVRGELKARKAQQEIDG